MLTELTSTAGEEYVLPLVQYHAQDLLLFDTEENLVQFPGFFRCHVSWHPIRISIAIAVEQKVNKGASKYLDRSYVLCSSPWRKTGIPLSRCPGIHTRQHLIDCI